MEHCGSGIAGVKHNLEVFPVVIGCMEIWYMIAKTLSVFLWYFLRHYSYVHNFLRVTGQLYRCKCTNNNATDPSVMSVHQEPQTYTESCDLYSHLQEGLKCLGNGDLLQFFKFVDAVLDKGTQFITVIQLLFPEGTRKEQKQ